MTEFKLPSREEAEQRLDEIFGMAFTAEHPAHQDWVAMKFAMKECRRLRAGLQITEGALLAVTERNRQIQDEKWSVQHDDEHCHDELARGAAWYLFPEGWRKRIAARFGQILWPWETGWWRPTPRDRLREVVKGAALAIAEVDRLLRLRRCAHHQVTLPMKPTPPPTELMPRILEIIAEKMHHAETPVDESKTFTELGIDALAREGIFLACEQEFFVVLPETTRNGAKTPRELRNAVEALLAAKNGEVAR